MKKKALLVPVLMTLTGFLLIGLSIFVSYQGKLFADEKVSETTKELSIAQKNIDLLNHEVIKKITVINSNLNKSEDFDLNKVVENNIPIIEISDTILSVRNNKEFNEKRRNGKRKVARKDLRQLSFSLLNVGKNSLHDVVVSIKDIYKDPKGSKGKSRITGKKEGREIVSGEIGAFENFEINTLPLKTERSIYSSTLTDSPGIDDYFFHVIVEWSQGFYQMNVSIAEIEGKLIYSYDFFDADGNYVDFKDLKSNINQ